MKDLVIMRNKKAVTTSLKVAESFQKAHRDVMRAIRNFTAQNCAVKNMFVESTYINQRGQEHPMFYMNRDGFSLLVMGFTGNKALQFKLQYIEEFNKMEEFIKEQEGLPQTPEEKLDLTMKVTSRLDHRLNTVEDDIAELKENSEINSLQRYQLLQTRKKRVLEVIGGKESNYYRQHKANKVFSALGGDFRKVFEVPRYDALPKKKFEKAIEWTKTWYPDVILKGEITSANKQIELL